MTTLDKRGTGLSDQEPEPTFEGFIADIEAVVDVAMTAPAHVVTGDLGSLLGIHLAANRPDLVRTLTIINGTACLVKRDGYEIGIDGEHGIAFLEKAVATWAAEPVGAERMSPGAVADGEFAAWATRHQRLIASPGTLRRIGLLSGDIDLRAELPSIAVPTNVVHSIRNRYHPISHGRFIADRVPDATIAELDSNEHSYWRPPAVLAAVSKHLHPPQES